MHKRNESYSNNTSRSLLRLIDKIIVYRFTRNLDKALASRRINHSELSQATGRAANWFNHAVNAPEDMRMSTFLRVSAAIENIIEHRGSQERDTDVTFDELIDDDLMRLSSLANDLRTDSIENLIDLDSKLYDLFVGLKVYVEALKGVEKKVTPEEFRAFKSVIETLTIQEDEKNDPT